MKKGSVEATNIPSKEVDEYLAHVPEDARAVLEQLRKTIRSAAPQATEGISYQMPTFKHHGMLVSFAAFKDHCSLFPGPAAIEAFKEELKGYRTSKGTIQFKTNNPLPEALVRKIVTARLKENEARAKR